VVPVCPVGNYDQEPEENESEKSLRNRDVIGGPHHQDEKHPDVSEDAESRLDPEDEHIVDLLDFLD
jgi:hypothetical protein